MVRDSPDLCNCCQFKSRRPFSERLSLPDDADDGAAAVGGRLLWPHAELPGRADEQKRLHLEILPQVDHPAGLRQVRVFRCGACQHLEGAGVLRPHGQGFHAIVHGRPV